MSFSWNGRSRRVVVTAFTEDRRILQQWDLNLTIGQRIPLPEGTRTVQLDDPKTITRRRVELGLKPRVQRPTPWRST
jgi:hypothetical protein